jgi:hypothetical protein
MTDEKKALENMQEALKDIPDITNSWWRYYVAMARSVNRETAEMKDSLQIAAQISLEAARENPMSMMQSMEIMEHSRDMLTKGLTATQEKMRGFLMDQSQEGMQAWLTTLFGGEGENLKDFMKREADVMETVANFNEQIEAIKDEFGFQFHTKDYKLAHETSTFKLYQVLPIKKGVKVNNKLKPMILVPPYMLGVHILGFLPFEDKSYAHSFANEGIPTYVRVVKDIMEEEAVQKTTPENDCLETKELLEVVSKKHGNQKVTLNGTCQGGYISLMNVLSGKLTDVCDTLITNVAPIDGTYSEAISGMPYIHHDFLTTTLPNGNQVANGYMLSLGMRFVAIEREAPLIKVLDQASLQKKTNMNPGKTVAALFRWLLKERAHLPLEIAKMSSHTFREPISDDGVLPVQLFGKDLKVRDLEKLGYKWYMDYALKDDLVTPPCATAANKFLEGTDVIEDVPTPLGHVAVLTTPYNKRSPVNDWFETPGKGRVRGPVRFQLDISDPKATAKTTA